MIHKVILTGALLSLSALVNAGEINILSAVVKDKVISDATVIVQRPGEASTRSTSNISGKAAFNTTDDTNSTLLIQKTGYSTLVAKCPCDGLTYALSPVMNNLDGMRIVLTWGRSPADLDSHLSFPNNHVYFNKKLATKSNLDVDDLNSYGPETITIDKKIDGKRYVYAVHDYTNRKLSTSKSLGRSGARVQVYVGETLIRTYKANPQRSGTSWTVFGIDEQGAFHDIDAYNTAENSNVMETAMAEIINKSTFESQLQIADSAKLKAKKLNTSGEKIYHQKDLLGAMYKFQQAVDLSPNFAQAYSNLGLTYQKLGRGPEAIWANKKAIELASGSGADRVKASSYYNIAKTYEHQAKWQQSLSYYKKALAHRQHSAYTKGIARIKEKLNN